MMRSHACHLDNGYEVELAAPSLIVCCTYTYHH